jgi:hypothetical protein
MSRKHFVSLARALADRCPDEQLQIIQYPQWLRDVEAVCEVCNSFNVNFDSRRFIEACKSY